MAQLQNISDTCGFTDYLDFVTYPPAGQLPFPAGVINGTTSLDRSCEIWDMIIDAVQMCVSTFVNKCICEGVRPDWFVCVLLL